MTINIDNTTTSGLIPVINYTTFLGESYSRLSAQVVDLPVYKLDDVRFASTANISGNYIAGSSSVYSYITSASQVTLTIDGTILNQNSDLGTRILVKNQTTPNEFQNGIYTLTNLSPYILTRATDFNENTEVNLYSKVLVSDGSVNARKYFYLSALSGTSVVIGTTSMTFTDYPSNATSLFYLKEFRRGYDALRTETNFDALTSFLSSVRTLENALPNNTKNLLVTAATALNTFYTSQFGSSFKTYYKDAYTVMNSQTVWTDSFRDLWRQALREELSVRIGSSTKTSGAWPAIVADKSISLNSTLVVKNKFEITQNKVPSGLSAFLVTVNATNEAGVTSTVSVSIPVGTAANSETTISSAGSTLFNGITSIVVGSSYGADGDVLEFWVKG